MADSSLTFAGDRLAKVIARAGLCSRRDAEDWIKDGRVAVNGKVIRTPAFNVTAKDQIKVDGQPLTAREGTRVWLYHKPPGLVVTEKDPEGRPTIFEALSQEGLPRVLSVGRLDINTEGLLLLTNDGGLKRVLELPATGWLRRYRVRAFGTVTQEQLAQLAAGIEVDGVKYGAIEAELEREQGANVWLTLALREGKNREVKNVLAALGLKVNRLIRTSFGPFQLGDLPVGAVEVVKARVLKEQLGKRLAEEAEVDFDSDLPEPAAIRRAKRAANPNQRVDVPGKEPNRRRASPAARAEPFHFRDDEEPKPRRKAAEADGDRRPARPPRRDEGRDGGREARGPRDDRRGPPRRSFGDSDDRAAPARRVFNADGSESEFVAKTYGKKPRPAADAGDDRPKRGPGRPAARGDFGDRPKRDFGDRPKRDFGDRPKRDFGDKPKRDFGDRPPRSFGDKPKRDFGDRPPRDFGDRPKRDFGDRPKRDFADRPKRDYGDRAASDRPKRDFGDRPKRDFGDRPKRDFGDKPPRSFGDKPKRDFGDRPKRDFGDRPKRDFGDRPKRDFGDRPPRPAGDGVRPKRPRGSGPGGDRPRRPRPPKA